MPRFDWHGRETKFLDRYPHDSRVCGLDLAHSDQIKSDFHVWTLKMTALIQALTPWSPISKLARFELLRFKNVMFIDTNES